MSMSQEKAGKKVDEVGRLRLRFSHLPPAVLSGSRVQWLFDVTNESERAVTLQFASGQRGDVELKSGSDVVYTWSEEESLKVDPGEYDCAAVITFSVPQTVLRATIVVQ